MLNFELFWFGCTLVAFVASVYTKNGLASGGWLFAAVCEAQLLGWL